MKMTENSLILNKNDVTNVENRLFALSNSIFDMNVAKHQHNKKIYRKAWANVLFEACRIDMIKKFMKNNGLWK